MLTGAFLVCPVFFKIIKAAPHGFLYGITPRKSGAVLSYSRRKKEVLPPIGWQQKFHAGEIPDDAKEQQHGDAAPEQDVFCAAVFGEPFRIPQCPDAQSGEPEGREDCQSEIFSDCAGNVQPEQLHAEV